MFLELDPTTAEQLKMAEVECSRDAEAGGVLESEGPVVLFTSKFDRECYIGLARNLLGNDIVDELLALEPKAELRVVPVGEKLVRITRT